MGNNIKLWLFSKWECLHNYQNINQYEFIFSACFLDNNKQIFILTSNYCNENKPEKVKVYDLNGTKIKEINNSNEETVFIDSFFDKKTSKYFIITGNRGYIKSYDFNNNKVYYKYDDKGREDCHHHNIVIEQKKDITKMFESELDKYIRIWNFHSGKLLKKILIFNKPQALCLLNEKYLLVGNLENIKIYDLEEDKLFNDIHSNKEVVNIKLFYHPKLGECIVSQNYDDVIKLWTIEYKKI